MTKLPESCANSQLGGIAARRMDAKAQLKALTALAQAQVDEACAPYLHCPAATIEKVGVEAVATFINAYLTGEVGQEYPLLARIAWAQTPSKEVQDERIRALLAGEHGQDAPEAPSQDAPEAPSQDALKAALLVGYFI